jgi:hypothetical protein
MTKENTIKQQQTKEEKAMEKVDSKKHPSHHKNEKDLMTAEELEEYDKLIYPTDTLNLGA